MTEKDAFDLWCEWATKDRQNDMLTISAEIHGAVMSMSPEDRNDRAKINEAVRKAHMDKPANDNPGFLVSSEIIAQNAEPLIGEMTLSTDQGDIVLSINQESAGALIEELTAFLSTE